MVLLPDKNTGAIKEVDQGTVEVNNTFDRLSDHEEGEVEGWDKEAVDSDEVMVDQVEASTVIKDSEKEDEADEYTTHMDKREMSPNFGMEVDNQEGSLPEFEPVQVEDNRRNSTGNKSLESIGKEYLSAAELANKAIRSLHETRSEGECSEDEDISSEDEDFILAGIKGTGKSIVDNSSLPKRNTRSSLKIGGGRGKTSSGKKKGGRKGNSHNHI